jgi:hypothetical protein
MVPAQAVYCSRVGNHQAREAGFGVKRKADLNDIRAALLSQRDLFANTATDGQRARDKVSAIRSLYGLNLFALSV